MIPVFGILVADALVLIFREYRLCSIFPMLILLVLYTTVSLTKAKPTLMRTLLIIAFLSSSVFIFTSCKKERSKEYAEATNLSIASKELKQHRSRITEWVKFLPLNGSFKEDVKISSRTINRQDQLITSVQIGGNGNSFVFISGNKQFHAYGVNAKGLNSNRSGYVEVYDFQDLTKKVVKYKEGKAEKFQYYSSDGLLNAYKGLYPVNDLKATNAGLRPNSDNPTLVKAIRKFFCQLFGGFWRNSIAENSNNPNGDCSFGDNNNEVPVDFVGDEGGGGASWGLIFPNLNDLNFFDLTSTMWNNIQSGLNGGSAANNWNLTTPAGTIDASCPDPERIRTLFYILNTKSNQQLSYVDYGSFENTLEEYQTYKNQVQVPLPITPLLLKGGPNGSVDALLQAQYLYQTENNNPSFGAAFGHDNFNRVQASASINGGLSYWHIPPFSIGTSAFIALEDVLVKEIDGAYGTNNYDLLGYDFIAKFYQQLGVGNIDAGNPRNTLNVINPMLFSNIQTLKLNNRQALFLLNHTELNTHTKSYLDETENSLETTFHIKLAINELLSGAMTGFKGINHTAHIYANITNCCPVQYFAYIEAKTAMIRLEHPNWGYWRCYFAAQLELLQDILDIIGFVPVVGEVADLTNGIIYTIQGDGVNASLSFAATIPIGGWVATGAKWARKTIILSNGTKAILNWYRRTDGIITFGAQNSGQFRKILGLLPGDPRQAHHIIPCERAENDLVQKAAEARTAFHMQDALNGVPLTAAQHLGSHPNYTNRVTNELNNIRDRLISSNSFTPENAYTEIVDLTNRIKQAIINNPNTPIDQLIF
jgi:hypothetical protein